MSGRDLLRLDVRELDHLRPLLGLVGDELAEIRRRHQQAPVPPRSASRALIFGSASAALISLLSLSMISVGVLAARRPRTSRSPRSRARTRPRSGHRAAPPSESPASPQARAILPALMCSIDEGRLSNMTWTCPLIRSVSAGAEPRYGTCTMFTPVIILNISPATCAGTSDSRRRHVELARIGFGVGDELGDGLHR